MNAKKNREYYRKYREANRKKVRQYSRDWRKKNPERDKELGRQERTRLKADVFNHYGKGKVACKKCGFSDYMALEIDHIKNNGADERRRLFGNRLYAGTTFYRWLRKNGYPTGYQILCANCNIIKRRKHQLKCQKK